MKKRNIARSVVVVAVSVCFSAVAYAQDSGQVQTTQLETTYSRPVPVQVVNTPLPTKVISEPTTTRNVNVVSEPAAPRDVNVLNVGSGGKGADLGGGGGGVRQSPA